MCVSNKLEDDREPVRLLETRNNKNVKRKKKNVVGGRSRGGGVYIPN